MIEQEHVHIEYDKGTEPNLQTRQNMPAWIISGGIVLASIIFSGSLLFGARFVAKTMSENLGKLFAGQVPAVPSTAPNQPGAPTGPVAVTERKDQPTLGNKNAKVTIVEFADFQCPFCKQYFENTFAKIKKDYIDTGKVKYVYRHYPLTQIHKNAEISGVASECANDQGKFWEYHDILYKNSQSDGSGLDKDSLIKYANDLGLNKGTLGFGKNKFSQCLQGTDKLKIVQADQAEGVKAGVNGTPSFYINGVQLVGAQPYTAFKTVIDNALK